jgi:hypothetical protein
MPEESDPKLVEKLKGFPPYEDETPEEAPVVPETQEEAVEAPVEAPQIEEVTPVEETKEELPEDTSKRTAEQFDKLKESNNNLKQALEVEKKKNILDSLMPTAPKEPVWPESPITNQIPPAQQYPGLSQKQVNETFDNLVDGNGYVDTGLLISTLTDLRTKNKLAEERARVAEQNTQKIGKRFEDFERNEIMKSVHAQFPTLDPNNENFDEKLWKFVRNEVIDQWMNGKQTDVMAAAAEGMDTLHGNDMKKADKEKLVQAETAKKNINALGSSQSAQRDTYSEHDTLVRAVQQGKKGALAERLRKAGM